MCRIVGIVDFNKSLGPEIESVVISMRDSLSHGGPDDAGIYIDKGNGVALGHRRLSIIDLSPLGHQPMSNHNKTIWITYNGEIYNFQELRNELVSLGHSFKSKTDTEVLIYGYEKWGIEKLLPKLRGMFSFAIYDRRDENNPLMMLVRDRLGIKPLYYYFDEKKLIFASEVKGLMKSNLIPDKKDIGAKIKFLQLGSIPQPLTTIENVFSLLPGHYLILSNNKKVSIKKYWNIQDHFENSPKYDFKEVSLKIKESLEEAINYHLISDAPLGVFLSGGIDSSSIVAIASKLSKNPLFTLNINFKDEEFSESKYAQIIARKYNTNHKEILLEKNSFLDEMPAIFNSMDQPTVDGVNTYFISKAAKECGLKVVLSGVGADEVFLGYRHFRLVKKFHLALKILSSLFRICPQGLIAALTFGKSFKLAKAEYLKCGDLGTYLLFRGLFSPSQIQKMLNISESEFKSNCYGSENFIQPKLKSAVNNLIYMDFYHYLQDQILKDADSMGMAHGVEIRVPFLDHKLVELLLSVDPDVKLQGDTNKLLLTSKLNLPEEVVNREKKGFVLPFAKWLNEPVILKEIMDLNEKGFNNKYLSELLKGFKNNKVHWSRIWALYVLNKFF